MKLAFLLLSIFLTFEKSILAQEDFDVLDKVKETPVQEVASPKPKKEEKKELESSSQPQNSKTKKNKKLSKKKKTEPKEEFTPSPKTTETKPVEPKPLTETKPFVERQTIKSESQTSKTELQTPKTEPQFTKSESKDSKPQFEKEKPKEPSVADGNKDVPALSWLEPEFAIAEKDGKPETEVSEVVIPKPVKPGITEKPESNFFANLWNQYNKILILGVILILFAFYQIRMGKGKKSYSSNRYRR